MHKCSKIRNREKGDEKIDMDQEKAKNVSKKSFKFKCLQ